VRQLARRLLAHSARRAQPVQRKDKSNHPNQITYAYGSLIKSDNLYNLCFPRQIAPAAVCQNGVMDSVLHPIEPLAIRVTLAGAL
jgi:hypothetical protein